MMSYTMSYAMSYAMLYARTYDMQVKTYDVLYDENIRCRTSDLRYRMHVRHRMLRCRTCLAYDIDMRCRTCTTYGIVRVRCRTCNTYDIVCNIGIIRCRTSDVRHRTSARIQMPQPARPGHSRAPAAVSLQAQTWHSLEVLLLGPDRLPPLFHSGAALRSGHAPTRRPLAQALSPGPKSRGLGRPSVSGRLLTGEDWRNLKTGGRKTGRGFPPSQRPPLLLSDAEERLGWARDAVGVWHCVLGS